jgi:hypothetical protein
MNGPATKSFRACFPVMMTLSGIGGPQDGVKNFQHFLATTDDVSQSDSGFDGRLEANDFQAQLTDSGHEYFPC